MQEGVWHIWVGFDHIIFVLTLILGILLSVKSSNQSRTQKLVSIIKVVSAFTVAHSITLALASLQIIVLPAQAVEVMIAVTLVYAALHNIQQYLPSTMRQFMAISIWKMALIFGLIHGFGFANVLSDINLTSTNIAFSLLAFNLGVELGQIVAVVTFSLFIFAITSEKNIKNNRLAPLFPVSSAAVMLLATIWIFERSFNIVVL